MSADNTDVPGGELDAKAKIRLRNRDAQRRLRARKRAAAQEAAKTLEEVDDAIAKAEDANDQLDVDNHVLEKVIAVREEFIGALQHLHQLDLAVQAGDTSSKQPLPPEVHDLTSMSPEDFAAQWRRWHRVLKTRYELAEACGWSGEACQELEQHVSYLATVFQALTLTAPDNVLALYTASTEQSSSVAENLARCQNIALSLDPSESQMAELRAVYEIYLRRMARLIANRNIAYSGVGKVRQEGGEAGQTSSLAAMLSPSPPSLINLAKNSGELQRSLEQVVGTYKTEYHVINDLLDSLFAILAPRQLAHIVAQSDPLIPDYLQVLCCLMNSGKQQQQQQQQRETGEATNLGEPGSQGQSQQQQQQQQQQQEQSMEEDTQAEAMEGLQTADQPQAPDSAAQEQQ